MTLDPETVEQIAAEVAARLRPPPRLVDRIALRPSEACEALGVGEDFFRDHIEDELRWVRRGRLKLVTVKELERWATTNSAMTLGVDR